MTYGRVIPALRRFTQASLNKEPSWRRKSAKSHPRTARTRGLSRLSTRQAERMASDAALESGHSSISFAEVENLLVDLATIVLSKSYRIMPHPICSATKSLKSGCRRRTNFGRSLCKPQIEATLGHSQKEWLEDPIRWYQQIHPEDKARWSVETAQMFSSGTALRSAYRVLARDGRVVWFHCEAECSIYRSKGISRLRSNRCWKN
jgi:hypothetical protein